MALLHEKKKVGWPDVLEWSSGHQKHCGVLSPPDAGGAAEGVPKRTAPSEKQFERIRIQIRIHWISVITQQLVR